MAAESAWKLGGLSWKQLGKRSWTEFNDDEILDRSAALSYYFLGAIFPLLLVLFSLLGVMAGPGSHLRQSILQYIATALPSDASGLVQRTLDHMLQASGGGKIGFGLLLSLWSASAGMTAVISALNVVYDVQEQRSLLKVRAIAIGLTLAISVCMIIGLGLVLYGGNIAELVGQQVGLGSAFVWGWKILQWPVIIGFLLLSFALTYYFAPSLQDQRWEWVTPGSVLGLALWLVTSIGFKIYLHYFNGYSATYGSLGAVIILMLWFYVSGISILMGAEVNSEIEHAAAEHGDKEAKARGEIAPGVYRPRHGMERPQPAREKRPAA